MRHYIFDSVFFWFLVCHAGPVAAQIVNVLSESNAALENGFSGHGELSFEQRRDASSYRIVTASMQNYMRQQDHVVMFLLSRDYGEQNDELFSNSSFAHLRYRYLWTPSWEWEWFAQFDKNPFRRLSSRRLIGTGPKYKVNGGQNLDVSLGFALMREFEIYEGEIPDEDRYRWSIALQTGYQYDDRLSLQLAGYYQPETANLKNARVSGTAAMVFSIKQGVEFKLSYQSSRDATPPSGVPKIQSKLTNSLVYHY